MPSFSRSESASTARRRKPPHPYLPPPEVSTDGQRVALTFGKILDHPAYTTTIRSAFTVTVDGTDVPVNGFSGGMAKVNVSVGRVISAGQTVVVSYDQSAAGPEALGDSDGNKVADFTTGRDGIPAVVNNSAVDLSPPELTGATVASSGVAIELAFDEDLDLPATIPAALKDAFSVTAAGDTVEISGLAADGSSGLQINLSSRILKDQAVVVSYDRSAAGTNALDDDAGNEVVDFTTGASGVPAVDNDSTQLSADATLRELIFSVRNFVSSALETVDLSPAFDPGIEMYSVSLVFDKNQVTFMPAVNHADATVAYFDEDNMALEDADTSTSVLAEGHQVDTAVGANTVKVKVTAPDGMTEKTYTVTVTRKLPTLRDAGVQANGTSVTLQFEAQFPSGTGTLPAAEVAAFTVIADGVERQITGIAQGITEAILDVTLSTPIYKDQAVVVSYDSAAGLVDKDGNKFRSFTTGEDGVLAVLNSSTVLRTAPGKPTGLAASASGDARIDLSWTAPASDGGSAITGYKIEVSTDGGTNWTDLVADTDNTDTTYSHTGLSPGSTRHYRVSAINAGGTSVASDSDDATTIDPPTLSSAEVPGLGTSISLIFSENLDLQSQFLPTSVENAFTVTVDGVESEVESVVASLENTLVISLSPKIYQGQPVTVSYDQSDAGTDALADSDGNEVASFTTGEDGVPAVVNNSTQTRPGPAAPTNFSATAGELQVALAWDAPASDSGVTRHEYRFKTSGEYLDDWKQIADSAPGEANEASFTVTGLTGGTAYTFELRAVSTAGDGAAAEDGPVTPSAILTPPTIDDVAVTSAPLLTSSGESTPDTYGEGETIEVSVTFNEAVTATTGTDFVLSVVDVAKRAPLLRGSGTTTLVFGYTVQTGDRDDDGIWIGDQDRTLVGNRNGDPQSGTIASVATTTEADLTHAALGQQSGHKVDGSQRVTSTDATLSALVVTYGSSEVPLSPFFAPDTTAYTASVANAVA